MALVITATDVELTKQVNVVMASSFLRRARQKLPYYMGTKPGRLSRQMGSATLSWRRIEQETPTTTPLAELTGNASYMQGRTPDTPTFTPVTATVAKYGQFYIVNEEVEIFSQAGTMAELVSVLGESAGRSMNQLQRDIAEENLTQRFAGNVASDGAVNTIVTTGILNRVAQELDTNAAMTFTSINSGGDKVGSTALLESFWAICHPHVASDVAGLTGFKSVETYVGYTRTAPGEFGYYGRAGVGIRFIRTPDASIDAGAGAILSGADVITTASGEADLYTIVVYGREALGSVGLGQSFTDGAFEAGDDTGDWEVIVKPQGSGGTSDPFNEVSTMAWKAWHAGAVLNANWGRAIRVAATNLSN